jgi:hypothetical protein
MNTFKRMVQVAVVVMPLAILVAGATAFTQAHQVSAMSATEFHGSIAMPGECRTKCYVNMLGCAGGKHFLEGLEPIEFQDFPHDCLPGTDCGAAHIECSESLALRTPLDFTKAAVSVENASPQELQQMIVGNEQQFKVNVSEGAVQISGCGGVVQAHIPLSDDQLRAVERLSHQ